MTPSTCIWLIISSVAFTVPNLTRTQAHFAKPSATMRFGYSPTGEKQGGWLARGCLGRYAGCRGDTRGGWGDGRGWTAFLWRLDPLSRQRCASLPFLRSLPPARLESGVAGWEWHPITALPMAGNWRKPVPGSFEK